MKTTDIKTDNLKTHSNGLIHRLIRISFAVLLTLVSGFSSAEDIEIYQGTFEEVESKINNNVLFVLDTSGSMNKGMAQAVVLDDGDEGTADTYTPPDNYDNSDIYVYDSSLKYTNQHFDASMSVCKSMKNFFADSNNKDEPQYFDVGIQWQPHPANGNKRYWNVSIDISNDNSMIVECGKDILIQHGINDASNKYKPKSKCAASPCGKNGHYKNKNNNNNVFNYSDYSQRIFVPKEYHDFLQEDTAPSVTYPTKSNGNNFCDSYSFSTERFYDLQGLPVSVAGQGVLSVCVTKISVLIKELNKMVDFNGVDIGLMRFNSNGEGGTLLAEIKPRVDEDPDDPDKDNPLTDLKTQTINTLIASGSTPLQESHYEAYLYFDGQRVEYGYNNGVGTSTKTTTRTVTVQECTWEYNYSRGRWEKKCTDVEQEITETGRVYNSPINNQCQSNAIVMLTDGLPTSDGGAATEVKALTGNSDCSTYGGINSCLPDLAEHLADVGVKDENGISHFLRTYTIGFGIDSDLLVGTAAVGTPAGYNSEGYFNANSSTQLQAAFQSILTDVETVSSDTFVSPAVSVSAFNRLQFRNELYFALFAPSTSARWNGNVKKYEIKANGDIVGVDKDLDVINETTGYFRDAAQSIWSAEVDGPVVEEGGFASNLTTQRRIFGNVSGDTVAELTQSNFVGSSSLVPNVGQVDTQGLGFGVGSSSELTINRTKVAQWTMGVDIDSELGGEPTAANQFVGDSIHATPFVISYGTTDAQPKDIIFSISNQGMLYAINGDSGTEAWSYIPDLSLFENLGSYYNNTPNTHTYGLDAEPSFLLKRGLEPESGDEVNGISQAIMFAGQRRGGSKYFAIDITNADEKVSSKDPVAKLWTIQGGSGDFASMGNTWAEAVPTQINYCLDDDCDLIDVVILGGGYDNQYDDVGEDDNNGAEITLSSLANNVKGNAIYIVAAHDVVKSDSVIINGGDLLWMAGGDVVNSSRDLQLTDMKHAIPSSPTAIDITGDGAVDIIFAVDLSGKVFRFDLKATSDDTNDLQKNNNSSDVSGGIIADLTESGADRLFYNPIDVTITEPTVTGDTLKYNLMTGSGFQAHPTIKEDQKNRFYVIYDENISEPLYIESSGVDKAFYDYQGESSPSVISGLSALTQTILDNKGDDDPSNDEVRSNFAPLTTHKHGFYLELKNTTTYEKILRPSLTVDGRVIFVSYLPDNSETVTDDDDITCSAGVGRSIVYNLDLETATFEQVLLSKSGLAGKPTLIYVTETIDSEEVRVPIVIVGTEPLKDLGIDNLDSPKAVKSAWWEKNRDN